MIKLAFTGDIMLSRRVEESLASNQNGWSLLSKDVKEKLQGFDYVIGNLECPIAVNASRLTDNSFKAKPISLEQISNFNLLTLANNHSFDCGKEGADETLKYLKEYGYSTTGLTGNKKDVSKFITNIQGKSIGFISAAVNECIKNENDQPPFITQAEDSNFLEGVRNLRKEVDYVFLIIHGGNEMISYPEPSFRDLCKSLIDVGADCVITHHPHVLGGFEILNNKPIIYSLGDFIFDGQSYKRRRGAILSISIICDRIEFELVPTHISDSLRIELATKEMSEKIIGRWNYVSRKLKSDSYEKNYKKLYVSEIISFQTDRLKFIYNKNGLLPTCRFILSKIKLISVYISRILTGKIK